MRSSNPVFSRRGFSRDNGYAGFDTAPAGGRQGSPYAPAAGQLTLCQQDLQQGAPRPQ